MADQQVLYSVDQGVATITLNRPKRGNALTPTMVSQFLTSTHAAINDPKVRVLVLTGAGKFFCTGMDLGMTDDHVASDSSSPSDGANHTQTLFSTLLKCPKPTIARINGPALGGGLGLVFACNFRIVDPSAYFSMPEVHRGLIPALISEVIVPQLGPFLSKQYMLSGERIPALEAHRVGFVTAVVGKEPRALDEKVEEYIAMLKSGGPGAMRDIKQLVDACDSRGADPSVVPGYVRQAFAKMITSEEAAHGIGAFASREKPNWDDFGLGSDTKAKL